MQRGPPTVPSRVHRNSTQDLRPRNHPLIHELCAPQPHRPRLRPPIFSVSSIQCSLRARGARRTSRKHGRKMEERAGKGPPPPPPPLERYEEGAATACV